MALGKVPPYSNILFTITRRLYPNTLQATFEQNLSNPSHSTLCRSNPLLRLDMTASVVPLHFLSILSISGELTMFCKLLVTLVNTILVSPSSLHLSRFSSPAKTTIGGRAFGSTIVIGLYSFHTRDKQIFVVWITFKHLMI